MRWPFLTLVAVILAQPGRGDPPRKPHPLVPSLPLLAADEEDKIDQIIDRFILFDIGKLPGPDGQRALADFQKLGPDAFFALVRGFNKAAQIEATCPAVTIGRKLLSIMRGSNDPALLDFARENIGAGLRRPPHMGVIKDLHMVALLRKKDIAAGKLAAGPPGADNDGKIVIRPRSAEQKALAAMSVADLAKQSATTRGDRLKDVLVELEKRTGEGAIEALVAAAGHDGDSQLRYFAQEMLLKNLGRQPADLLKAKLKDPRAEVRTAAAWVVAEKKLPFVEELIELLNDKDLDVGQASRQALNRIAGGDTDFGPNRGATDMERADAVRQWRSWWAQKNGR
jgi:hypothetical protein